MTTIVRSPARHVPMPQFPVVDGELTVGGIPLTRLAARIGRTPFYAYDRAVIAARMSELRSALPPSVRLHYAVKANPMPALVCALAQQVDGLDVASAGELKLALDAGMASADISFAGPGKTAAELEQAVASGVLVNLESAREIDLLAEASNRCGQAARVALRLNPDYELKSSGMKMGGGAKPFGVDAEQAPAMLRRIGEAGLAFEGFHVFAGSQNLDGEAIAQSQRLGFELVLRLAAHAPTPVRSVNLGGGFGIPYFPGEQRLDLGPIRDTLGALQEHSARALPGAHLVLELGRYLVGEAGLYVCRILDRKESRGTLFLVADGGLHHHLAASGNFGQVLRKNYPVAIGNRMIPEPLAKATVVGPLCTPLDLLAADLPLGHGQPGDLVVVFQSGAYGASASPQGFLGHPPALEVLV